MRAFDEGNLTASASEDVAVSGSSLSEKTDWQRFGFNGPAFEDNQDADYFEVASWSECFDELHNFSQAEDPLLVLPGIPGCGKTSLLNLFMSQRSDPLQLHYLKARSIFTLRHLLNAVSENFADFRNVSINTDQFIKELRNLSREHGPQLLIIDDAQHLSKETMTSLFQVIAEQNLSDLWVRVILCGEPQLEDRVQALFEELEFSFSFPVLSIPSFTINETRSYLKRRLDEAGFKGSFPFSKSMVKHIHTLSSGFPGRINRVAQQVLIDINKNQTWQGKSNSSFAGMISANKVKIISVSLLIFSAWLWVTFEQSKTLVTKHHTMMPIANRLTLSEAAEKPTANIVKQTQNTVAIQADQIPQETHQAVETETNTVAIPAETSAIRPNPQADLSFSQERSVNGMDLTKSEVASINKIAPKPIASKEIVKQEPVPSVKKTTPVAVVKKQTTQVAEKAHAVVATKAKKTTAVVASLPKPTLKVLPKGGYTIQLIGVHSKDRLAEFASEAGLGEKARYYSTKLKGKPWYVLIYGQYETEDQAEAAIESMPEMVQDMDPWVRTVQGIKYPTKQLS